MRRALVGSSGVRVGVLASGGGSILEAILADGIPVDIVLVDRACGALDVAARFDVAAEVVERESFGTGFDRVAYTERVVTALRAHDIELVVMAGFGTILEKPIHEVYGGRILNSHPALLPAFPGWHAVADALAHGVKVTGTTIHVADLEVDTGPILAQEHVDVRPDDSVESLHERIKVVERRLYPATIRQILERGSVLPS
jgi:phosphoribosylglycinamide formyltransferase 1